MGLCESCFSEENADTARGIIREVVRKLRQKVLRGDFACHGETPEKWKVLSNILAVFFSSTFTDTHTERNILLQEILPELRRIGRGQGVEVRFVDMRYGVKDESTIYQLTWEICVEQLEKCFRESAGIAFVSLQGDKYGYMPLPREVKKDDYECRYRDNFTDEMRNVADEWYRFDANTQNYILKNLKDKDDNEYWNNALPILRKGFDMLEFDPKLYPGAYVGRSVTEWEVSRVLSDPNRRQKSVWAHRIFLDEYEEFSQTEKELFDKDFSQRNNTETMTKLGNLHKNMKDYFSQGENKFFEFPISWRDYMDKSGENIHRMKYLEEWKICMMTMLKKNILDIVEQSKQWDLNAHGLNIPGKDAEEMLHHYAWGNNKVTSFVARQELIDECEQVIAQVNRCDQTSVTKKFDFSGISLAIVGVSGAGKTALMAKLAHLSYKKNESVPVLLRFCGTSRGSNTGLELMKSLCMQIIFLYKAGDLQFMGQLNEENTNKLTYEAIPVLFDEVVKHFHFLLAHFVCVLYIDSLDQLANDNMARSHVSFLDGVRPHRDTRIIVSMLPDEDKEEVTPERQTVQSGGGRFNVFKKMSNAISRMKKRTRALEQPAFVDEPKYWYGPYTKMMNDQVPVAWVQKLSNSSKEITTILTELLSQKNMTITRDQMDYAVGEIAEYPTALYLRLAMRVISRWTSFGEFYDTLPPSVPALIDHIYSDLETTYGKAFCSHTLAFLTFSKSGVSSTELEDLLSMDNEVLEEVFQYSDPKTGRLPSHVLSRLLSDLEELVAQGENGVYRWYHRQLREAAERRYKDLKLKVHKTMAIYFCNFELSDVGKYGKRQDRRLQEMPLLFSDTPVWFDKALVNRRRCVEGAYHCVQANMLKETAEMICDVEAVCAHLREGEGFNILDYVIGLNEKGSNGGLAKKMRVRVYDYYRWLLNSMSALVKKPTIQIGATLSSQPTSSICRKEYLRRVASFQNDAFKKDSFITVQAMGGFEEFGACLMSLQGHSNSVNSVCFNHDGSQIASGSDDKTVKVWNAKTGDLVQTLEGHSNWVGSVCFNHDGSQIASGSYDNTVKVWNAKTGDLVQTLEGHSKYVSSVCFNRDGSQIASGSWDKTVKVWNAKTGDLVQTLEGHRSSVRSVCFNRDGSQIASGSSDDTVKVWNAKTGDLVQTLEGHSGGVNSVCFNHDGSQIASGFWDKTVKVWNAKTGDLVQTLEGHSNYVSSVCFNHDGSQIASGSWDKTVKVWNAKTGDLVQTLEGHSNWVGSVCFNHDGSQIASGSYDNTVKVWNAKTGDLVQTLEGHSKYVSSVCFNRDGSQIASGSWDKTVKVWNAKTGDLVQTLEGHRSSVRSVCFNRDGSQIASGSSDDKTVKVWNAKTGDLVQTFVEHSDEVKSVCFNHDGSQIAVGLNDGTVEVWNAKTGDLVQTLEGHTYGVKSVCFNHDGSQIASGSYDYTVKVWNAKTGDLVQTLEGHSKGVNSVCFNHDGSQIASGSDDRTVKVWNAKTGDLVQTLEGHSYGVTSVCFNHDGSQIASGSYDYTVKVWNAKTGDLVQTLEGHSKGVNSVCFNHDGSQIASGSSDKTVKVWSAHAIDSV